MRFAGKLVFVALIGLVLASCDSAGSDEPRTYTSQRVTYEASVLGGRERPLVVALPSDYDQLDGPLPVLYLLHGWGGSETNWTQSGDVLNTLGRGYDEGDVAAMIVVMPNNVYEGSNPLAGGPNADIFLREIREDIIPFVEANFKASSRREDRAIAGLSAGGIQTLNLTLFYPELWSYSFPMSTAYFPEDQARLQGDFSDDLRISAINELVEFELAIAPDDALFYAFYQSLQERFTELGIEYTTSEGPGAHTWIFWKAYFQIMAPRLFR